MPIIKIYGFNNQDSEAKSLKKLVTEAVSQKFEAGACGVVIIDSSCTTCDQVEEKYTYIEINFSHEYEVEKILSALKNHHLGLDIVTVKLHSYIPPE